MGNLSSCEKVVGAFRVGREEKVWQDCARAYTPPYDCAPCTVRDLRLRRGDLLQVLEETELWYYVRKRTLKYNHTLIEERGYVPKHFVRRVCNLEAEPWFCESITKRIEAKRCLLRQENGEGAFMVWRSKENPQYYLSVRNGEAARHYKIVEVGRLFYLVPHKAFHTLRELVEAYSQDQGGLCVRLNQPCVMVKWQWYDEQWEVQRSSLRRVERLGSGEFGEVWSGVWNSNMEVAIKEFRAMDSDILNEIRIMSKLSHCRLLKLYGVCTMDMPFCIITELMSNGSLHRFLRGHKERKDLEFSFLMDFAIQIAQGMEYLEAQQIVHRDLRSENILLTDRQCCKIADFGLAQAYAGRQRSSSREKVPVKWMAPEIFLGEKYTPKSDVWSFGVLVTEIITYGEEPYSGRDKACCISAVCRGYRMPRPPSCPTALYDIILQCWRFIALDRPAFIELQERLTSLLTDLSTETTLLPYSSTETTELPDPSTEITQLPDPSTETTQLPKPNTEITQLPDSSTETTQLPDPSTETIQLPKPSTETIQLPDPSTETTQLPKPSTETTQLPDSSTETTLLPDPRTETILLPDPSTEISLLLIHSLK